MNCVTKMVLLARCRLVLIGLLALTILLFLGSLAGYAGEVRGVTDTHIKIAVIGDMTGPAALQSINEIQSFRNYFKYVNDQGGISGRKVKVVFEDDRYSIPAAISAFKKVVFRDRVLAMYGPSGAGHAFALFPQIKKEKLPTIVWSPAEFLVSDYNRYIFNSIAVYEDGIKLAFDYVMQTLKAKAPTIAIVYPDNLWGKSTREASIGYVGKFYKDKLKIYNVVLNMGEVDASSQVLNMRRKKIDYVIIQEVIPQTVALLRAAKRYHFSPRLFIGTSMTCEDEVVKLCGDMDSSLIAFHSMSAWNDDVTGVKSMKAITLKYQPKIQNPTRLYTHGFVSGTILEEGMKRAGRDLNNETLVDALEGITDFDTKGLCGYVGYSSQSHKASDYCKFYKADGSKGTFIPITGWMKPKD